MVDLDTQLALPLRLDPDGQLATVKTGSAAELAQRAACVCATRPGNVDGQPSFGVTDQTGRAGGPDLDYVVARLTTLIPGISVLAELDRPGLDQALAQVGVRIAT